MILAGVALVAVGAGLGLWLRRGAHHEPASAAAAPPAGTSPQSASLQTAPVLPLPPSTRRTAPALAPPASAGPRTAERPAAATSGKSAAVADAATRSERAPARAVTDDAAAAATGAPAAPKAATPTPRYRLSAISQRDGKPVAVLNDRVVFEGDNVDGLTVVRIGEAEVELGGGGKREIVPFSY
jgi:hypothetical protein